MTTAIEADLRKRGSAWRREFPIRTQKAVITKEPTIICNGVNSELAKRIENFEPSDSPLPLLTEELTKDFQVLNEARVGYQSMLSSKHPDYWPNYSESSRENIENLIKNYEWVRGSHAGNSSPLKGLEPYERLGVQRNPLEVIVEKCETARDPRDRLEEHAIQWATWILAKQKVKFTPEIKDLVKRAAENTAKTCMPNIFLQKLKERLIYQLQKPDSPEISFVDLKSGSIQEKVYPYLMLGYLPSEIAEKTGLNRSQIESIRKVLKKKNAISPLAEDAIRDVNSRTMTKLRKQPEFNHKRDSARSTLEFNKKQSERRLGKKHSLEARINRSSRKDNILASIYWLSLAGLSPYLIAQITGKSTNHVRTYVVRMRKNSDLPTISEEERAKRIIHINNERLLDKKIKNNFDKNIAIDQSLPPVQRTISDILEKITPVDLLSQEQKEALIERVARSVLESYEPNGNYGFHAQSVVWISQNLSQSLIYGKIKRGVASTT